MPWLELHFGPEPEKPRHTAGDDPAGKEQNPSELLRQQIRTFAGPYERYRDSKENKGYLAAVAYIGGGISLLTLNTVHLITFLWYAVFGEAIPERPSHEQYRSGIDDIGDGRLRRCPGVVAVGVP